MVEENYTSSGRVSELKRQMEFFRKNAPGCLDRFESRPVDLVQIEFDGHGEILNSHWDLCCRCGSSGFRVRVYGVEMADGKHATLAPVSAQCTSCGTDETVFDTEKHGYDAVACSMSSYPIGPAQEGASLHTCSCRNCGSDIFKLAARFEYPGDLFEEDFVEFRGREPDLFTWFSLVGFCRKCRTGAILADFECA